MKVTKECSPHPVFWLCKLRKCAVTKRIGKSVALGAILTTPLISKRPNLETITETEFQKFEGKSHLYDRFDFYGVQLSTKGSRALTLNERNYVEWPHDGADWRHLRQLTPCPCIILIAGAYSLGCSFSCEKQHRSLCAPFWARKYRGWKHGFQK